MSAPATNSMITVEIVSVNALLGKSLTPREIVKVTAPVENTMTMEIVLMNALPENIMTGETVSMNALLGDDSMPTDYVSFPN